MALPIKPTPVLRGDEAKDFERRVDEGRKVPLRTTCAPSLDRAKKAVFGDGKLPKK